MLWLLLVASILIWGRTYVWSIMLWLYGRAGTYEPVDTAEPFADASTVPAVKAIPAFPRPQAPRRAIDLQPAA